MKLSKTAQMIEISPTRRLFDLAKNYSDVIDFTLGDPDIIPAKEIRDAAISAINTGKTRYSANAGLIELRKSIAGHVEKLYGRKVDPEKEVIVTVGAMEALYLTCMAMIDPGDEVILFDPYYPNYRQMVEMCGGVPVIIHTESSEGFRIDMAKLKAAITPKTIAIIINNPCNPSGKVWSKQEVDDIAKIAKESGIAVISDEVYRTLIYEGEHYGIMNVPGLEDQAVLIDSFSKEFCMTGWRLGYAVANEPLISTMTRLSENVVACAPLASQHAGIAALTDSNLDMQSVYEKFKERRDYIYQRVQAIPGLVCDKPQGTFYLFIDVSKFGVTSEVFAKKLIESVHVAVAPGIAYGKAYDYFIRLAYTVDIPVIAEGMDRMERFIKSITECGENE